MGSFKPVLGAVLFLCFNSACFAVQGGVTPSPHSQIAQVSVSLGETSSGTLNRSFCSGTVVSNQMVVTAAHCLYGKDPSQLVVQFGSAGLTTQIFRSGVNIILPHEYQPYDSQLPAVRETHDVGILFFSGGIPAGFKAAKMVDQELVPNDDQKSLLIAGYGAPDKGTLSVCSTKIIDASFSRSEFQLLADAHCALGGGDSGGAVYRILENEVLLYGLHNWGWHHPDGTPAYTVETKLSFYGPWIRNLSVNLAGGS